MMLARLVLGLSLVVGVAAGAAEPPTIAVTIRNHRFIPSEIIVPVGKAFFLDISNEDPEPEEFEMRQPAIEKVIVGGGRAKVRIRPLGAGRYNFIGDYHPGTEGALIATADQ